MDEIREGDMFILFPLFSVVNIICLSVFCGRALLPRPLFCQNWQSTGGHFTHLLHLFYLHVVPLWAELLLSKLKYVFLIFILLMPVFFIKMQILCAEDVHAGMSQKDSELQSKFYRKNKIHLRGVKYFFEA